MNKESPLLCPYCGKPAHGPFMSEALGWRIFRWTLFGAILAALSLPPLIHDFGWHL